MCQNWAGSRSMLAASAKNRPSSGIFTGKVKFRFTVCSLDRPDVNNSHSEVLEWLLQQYSADWNVPLSDSPWKIAAGWVNEQQITPDYAPELG